MAYNQQRTKVNLPPPAAPPKIAMFPKPKKVRIWTPGEKPSIYHGMELEAIGTWEGLTAIPLPALPDRVGYMGFFKSEYFQVIDDG